MLKTATWELRWEYARVFSTANVGSRLASFNASADRIRPPTVLALAAMYRAACKSGRLTLILARRFAERR
jgi:hypothetical protein